MALQRYIAATAVERDGGFAVAGEVNAIACKWAVRIVAGSCAGTTQGSATAAAHNDIAAIGADARTCVHLDIASADAISIGVENDVEFIAGDQWYRR